MPSKHLNQLAPNSLVLVTGANGYLGSQVVDQLLQAGFRVRGTVRQDKPWLQEFFDKRHGAGKFELVIVEDLSVEADLKRVAEGVQGIAHVASDVSFQPDAERIVNDVVRYTELLLKVAGETPTVKSFVLTSSSSTVIMPVANAEGVRVDTDTWNEEYVRMAFDTSIPEEGRALPTYVASKTRGEQAAWKWVKENKPHFVFNTVLPSLVLGEILDENIHGSTQGFINKLLKGDAFFFNMITNGYSIDVKDTARLHVIALAGENVESQRIFGFANSFNRTAIAETLRRLRPDNKQIPATPENEGVDLTEVVPRKAAEQLLIDYYGQKGWTSFEQSLEEGAKGF